MSDTCPRCGAGLANNVLWRKDTFACGYVPGGMQPDQCRIRELESSLAKEKDRADNLASVVKKTAEEGWRVLKETTAALDAANKRIAELEKALNQIANDPKVSQLFKAEYIAREALKGTP